MKLVPDTKEAKWELLLASLLFLFLWIYLIIRANTVFYIHDEIVTKWMYMISWNPLPYQGFVDANNHFINSLLGGLFIRLLDSDAMWIVRLPSLLAFPIYFWSIFGLGKFFEHKINFYWLLISLTCSAFVIEYFGLARGYGISMAFLVFALWQTLLCFNNRKSKHVIATIVAWVLAVYVNLTLIPFALAGLAYLAIFLVKTERVKWVALMGLALVPLGYAIKYSFHLKDIGKLYLGGQEGFFETTIHTLTPYLWNAEGLYLDLALVVLTLFLLFTLIWNLSRSRNVFENKMVFSVFLVLGVCNILAQNWLLGINFPQDRAALYLIIFFFGALSFTADYWKNKWVAYPFILLTLTFFGVHMNLKKSIFFYYEHFDIELLTKIPTEVNGIPPSTGGRFWRMDNELTRVNNLPLNALQKAESSSDTLLDYIVIRDKKRTDILSTYHIIHTDTISKLALFERNHFLPRRKTLENNREVNGTSNVIIYEELLDQPLFFRCSGVLEDMDMFKKVTLVFQAEDTLNNDLVFYETIPLLENCAIQENGEIRFDFTIAIDTYEQTTRSAVYLWNLNELNLKGELKLEVYTILEDLTSHPGSQDIH